MVFGVWCLVFGVWGSGFDVWGMFCFRVASDVYFQVLSVDRKFLVSGVGMRVSNPTCILRSCAWIESSSSGTGTPWSRMEAESVIAGSGFGIWYCCVLGLGLRF